MIGVSFSDRVSQFAGYLSAGSTELPKQFSTLFSDSNEFENKENVLRLVQAAAGRISSEKGAKAFATALPAPLLKKIRKLDKDKVPELLRAYVTLRYCDLQNSDAAQTLARMKKAEITKERYRYRFASHAAKRNPSDFTDEVNSFNVCDQTLNRRLAGIALYFDAEKFCDDFIEFNLPETERDACYLTGLVRSAGLVSKILEDSFFLESLEKLSSSILAFLYKEFLFGQEVIEETIKKANSTLTPASLFTVSIQQADNPLTHEQKLGFKPPAIFESLEDSEQQALLAMLFLFKSHPKSENWIPKLLLFLKEIASFRDPSTRFAAVSIACSQVRLGYHPVSLFNHPQATIPADSYPSIYSLLLSICDRFCPEVDATKVIDWKNIEIRKQLSRFLAELLSAERLSDKDRRAILLRYLEDKTLQKPKALLDLSTCLASRLTKPLLEGQKPQDILLKSLQELLNRLGKPFDRSIQYDLSAHLNEKDKRKYEEDVGYYAQGLERLPYDEKKYIVPYFFRFLELSAKGQLPTERFKTKELTQLFQVFPIQAAEWQKPTQATVKELLGRFPHLPCASNDKFDLKIALQQSFEHNHISPHDFKEFYDFFQGKGPSTVLDGRLFGQYKASKNDEERKKAASHLLGKLYSEQRPIEHIKDLQKGKYFTNYPDFENDLKTWLKALEKSRHEEQQGEMDWRIIKSHDPSLLFRIGSAGGDTCQRVAGDPSKNKCLLAYPTDGKNGVIAALTKTDEIKARAILRFFYLRNNDTKKVLFPVLYLEPFYPGSASSLLRHTMTLLAIECAQQVGVPLMRHLKPQEPKIPDLFTGHHIITIEGPAPFEYFDGTDPKIMSRDEHSTSFYGIKCEEIQVLYDPKQPQHIHI